MSGIALPLVLTVLIGIPLAIVILVYLLVPLAKGFAWVVRQVFRFVVGMISEVLRIIGAVLTSIVMVPVTLLNVVIGRWSAAAHYGRAIEGELKSIGGSLYRLAIGHPARLLCLTALTEGFEKRIPAVVANAPGAERPSKRTGSFEGYTIVGSLPGGGSGSRLYVAEPSNARLAAFARAGQPDVTKVVIKCFSLLDGSSLPQIVRENRALNAAKRLGVILDDELTDDRFFYVTRYVPGESLGIVTQRLHAGAGLSGLSGKPLTEALDYAADLARTLHHYHAGGLWHKDVKPDNIIVADGQAHLVDFGLVTPLRSSMTLTTHGTEYFRDPEMVRMALRGVKVHEVDGAKFDIYAAGAVLYSIIENSFPAHGGLSQISKRCPEAIRWVVRRAMTDYDKRYESAALMLADIEAVLAVPDPFSLKPADLPSVKAGGGEMPREPMAVPAFVGSPRGSAVPPMSDEVPAAPRRFGAPAFAGAVAAAAIPAAAAAAVRPAGFVLAGGLNGIKRPFFRVTNWWTGKYDSGAWAPAVGAAGAAAAAVASPAFRRPAPGAPRPAGATAAEQLHRARTRAAAARERAQQRMAKYRGDFPGGVNAGVVLAFVVFLAVVGLVVTATVMPRVFNRFFNSAFNEGHIALNPSDALAELKHMPPVVIDFGDGHRMSFGPGTENPTWEFKSGDNSSGVTSTKSKSPRRSVTDRRTRRTGSTRTATPPAPPPEPAVPVVPARGGILVIRDHLTFEPEVAEVVDRQIAGLGEAGFNVFGNEHAVPADDDTEAKQQEQLLAELRAEVGVKPFASKPAGDAIRGWLDQHPQFTLVVWLGRSDEGTPESWMVARKGTPAEVVSAAADAMQTAARSPN